jgi:hypothetical protein
VRRLRSNRFARCTSGQALLEIALVLPLLLTLLFNTINFGYFFLVALNISASPRIGASYSTIGFATPTAPALPSVASVKSLTQADMTGALVNGSSTPVVVCSKIVGLSGTGAGQTAKCSDGTTPNCGTNPERCDPESPLFLLHRVDVTYSFTPLIPGGAFRIALPATVHRSVSMRVMD